METEMMMLWIGIMLLDAVLFVFYLLVLYLVISLISSIVFGRDEWKWNFLIAIILYGLLLAPGFMPPHQVESGEVYAIPEVNQELISSSSDYGTPEPYYTYTIKNNSTKAELEEALKRIRYPHGYEANVFDCSEMSGFCEHFLENEGFNTSILANETWGHAWISVYINGKSVNIECIPPIQITNNERYNHPEQVFKDIYEAEKAYPYEFDWWRSSPW